VVPPGGWFDFWTVVGEISRARGFGLGGAIINGHTQPQGALAGGICSCSTTLFNAALRYGLEMGDRRNHYYYITRYPLGLDATVFKSGGGSVQSMSFKNDTESPILIHSWHSFGIINFQLWSVDSGRRVSFTRPTVRNVRPATTVVQYTSSLRPGARKQIEFPRLARTSG
jgi:vancomycin resistance protein YoaR